MLLWSNITDKLVINGPVTGDKYVFENGNYVYVDWDDAELMLVMERKKTSCCGHPSGGMYKLFRTVP